jgi:CBS domain containing-hemolysin-like protein
VSGRRPTHPPPDRPSRHWWRRNGDAADGEEKGTGERGGAGEQERLIVQALADLRDMDVREVMTPRVDVVTLSIPVHEEDVARAVRESGHGAFPVVHDDLDDLVGVLFVTDLFRTRRTGTGAARPDGEVGPTAGPGEGPSGARGEEHTQGPSPLEISRRLRQPYIVPESRLVLDALAEMRRQQRGFAVVVDEYGGVSGVLTIKDLLEPLVGDLHDEFDPPDDEPAIVRVDGSRWLVDGRASVDDVRDRLGVEVPDGEYVTLGGFLFDGFGHIPEEGETLRVDGWDFRVTEMDKRRIVKVVAHRRTPAPEEETASGGTGDVVPASPVASDARHEEGRNGRRAKGPSTAAPSGGARQGD